MNGISVSFLSLDLLSPSKKYFSGPLPGGDHPHRPSMDPPLRNPTLNSMNSIDCRSIYYVVFAALCRTRSDRF